MKLTRDFDSRFEALLLTGRVSKWYSEVGGEATTVPAGLALEAGETLGSVVRQVFGTNEARSPLWTERSLWRELVVLRVDFEVVKAAAKKHDVTINDLFVTAATRAAARGIPFARTRSVNADPAVMAGLAQRVLDLA